MRQLGAGLLADGYEVAQRGMIRPTTGDTFADRAEGFRIGLLGSFAPPTYRSEYENRLLDDGVQWVHMRRRRPS